jgi:hypothetical protein
MSEHAVSMASQRLSLVHFPPLASDVNSVQGLHHLPNRCREALKANDFGPRLVRLCRELSLLKSIDAKPIDIGSARMRSISRSMDY